MFVIDVNHLDFSFENGDEKLFEDLSLSLSIGEVVGLVGANGCGKSTLLKLLIGELTPNAGQISLGEYGYLAQDASLEDLSKTLEQIFEERFGTEAWRGDLALEIGDLKPASKGVLLGSLSGGQRTRLGLGLILARASLPECLILDEPTNNLDKEGLEWLKRILGGFRGGVLIASHERAFLDEVVQRIVAIEDRKLVSYGGGYSLYMEQLTSKKDLLTKEYENYLSEVSKLTKFVKRTQDLNSKTSNEAYNKVKHESRTAFGYNKWHSEVSFGKQINSAQSKLGRLGEVERPEKEPVLDVRLESSVPGSKIVLKVEDLSKSFGQKSVLRDVNLEVRGPGRVLISGKNGSGKSTLLNLIADRSEADSGEVTLGDNLIFGYFSQDIYGLDQSKTPIEELSLLERDRARCYMLCVKAGLTKQSADKKISELSRGQQAKLGFVRLMLAQPDVLVLDEPTNHLDVQTKEAIEKALDGFGGAIILASHDKYFVEKFGVSQELAL